MMQIVTNFLFEGVEYMIYEAVGYIPGAAGIELLCSRKYGIGADRMLLFTGSQSEPSFRVFASSGEEVTAAERDVLVFAHYLRQRNISGSAAEFARALGDQALVKVGEMEKNIFSSEIHITDAFCGKMKDSDRKSNILAC